MSKGNIERTQDLLLLRPHSVHALCEFLSLFVVRQLTLHPNSIAVRRICDSPVDGAVTTTLQTVVTLASPRCVPVKKDFNTGQAPSQGPGLGDGLALGLRQELCRQRLLIDVRALLDSLHYSFVEFLQTGLREPLILDRLQLVASFTSGFCSNHELVEGLEVGVCGAENEGMIARVDVGAEQRCGFCVSASDGEKVGPFKDNQSIFCYLRFSSTLKKKRLLTHDICLRSDSD